MLESVRRAFHMIPRRLRPYWALMPVLGLLTGLMEGGSAGLVFALVAVLRDPRRAAAVPVLGRAVALFPASSPTMVVLECTLVLALYQALKLALLVANHFARSWLAGKSTRALSATMIEGYLAAPYPFHLRRHSADLIRKTTESVHMTVDRTLGAASALASETFVALTLAALMVAASPLVSLVAGGAMLVALALFLRLTRSLAARMSQRSLEMTRLLHRTLHTVFGGIKEIKALAREDYFQRSFRQTQAELAAVRHRDLALGNLPPLFAESIFVCGALIVIALTAVVQGTNQDGIALLALFAYSGFRLVPTFNRISWRIGEIRSARASVEDLHDDFVATQREAASALEEPEAPGAALLGFERLELDRVSYSYPGAAAPALRDVSLTIRRGESIGVVGPSGSGKSTLADLVLGLLPPTAGALKVDGVDVAPRLRAWRRQVGYVPQAIFLIDDTVRRNIALGLPDAEIDEARVAAAVRRAQLEALVASLPDGLSTALGERGVRLSGGERQRVGIARALYHDPAILVLDEATSALDTNTEDEVASAVAALHGDKTLIVIAHRLSTLQRCDGVVLMEQGRVVDRGRLEELAARSEWLGRAAARAGIARPAGEAELGP